MLSSVKDRLLRVSPDASGRLQSRALVQGQGMLSGIGRRVSSLFGILSPPVSDAVSGASTAVCSTAAGPLVYSRLLPQLHSVLWVGGASCLYTLTNSRLNKWEVDDGYEHHVLSWDVQKGLTESIVDAIWVSVNLQFQQNLSRVQRLLL